jgi:type IV fimbrial biogenesis protein FimT
MVKTTMRSVKGFSLIELMVVVGIMGIVMAIAVPGLKDLMAGQRVQSAAYDLMNSVIFARSEAGKRNATISIKAVTDNTLATGWCVNFGAPGTCSVTTPGSEVMRVQQPYSTVSFSWNTTAGQINFNTAGRITSPTPPIKIQISDLANTAMIRCVLIDVTGNTSSRRGAC